MSRRNSRGSGARIRIVATVVLLSTVGLAVVSASPASAETRTRHGFAVATGTFIGQPLVVTNLQPVGTDGTVLSFDGSSGDEWDGTLTGHTTYSGHGTVDLTTGAVRMVLHETFTGTIEGFGTGELQFVEYLQSGPDNLGQVDCVVTRGTGDLRRIRGGLEFKATRVVDPDPFGNGTSYGNYTGFLFR